ncbi:ATP-binding protein [Clostridium sp. SHJSY1]|uniref:sensor histidine kinase n=1 Tax=Clostridium sp. SHJSY1 TaxID=2942483 RepID=UPI002875BB2A|nr:ATP-binding protein [Clostridium sp. SHJSY1]MDS0527787.1 ATP-binding protein [Clostridium sp. SHJSY1]
MGIKFKLILFIALLLLIIISFLSFFVLTGIKNYQNKADEAILIKQKDMFEQYYGEYSNSDTSETDDKMQIGRGSMFNRPWLRTIPASVYNTKGELLSGFKTDGKLDENEKKNTMIKYAIDGKMSSIKINDVIYFYSPIKYNDDIVAILELEYSVKESVLFYNNIKKLFGIIGILALIIGIILGIVYFSKITKDIYIMKSYVENIKNGDFNNVKLVKRNDELGELSKGLSFMSSTIEKNIEELKVERDSLSIAVDKLKKMDKQQKEFIGNVTHEFRTPITTIKAYADVIGMYKDDFKLINDGTANISKECDRLATMVDKVLSLSALEKYDFEIQKKEINLKIFFDEICNRMGGRVRKNNLNFKCDVEDVVASIDEESLRHIVINLIDNGIKYNKPNGNIEIRCIKRENDIIITVSDTGIGIDKEFCDKIFEPFYRVESHRSRQTGGVGLGLALVKKLVEKQAGTIKAVSKLNEGTTFSIKFSI